MLKKILLGCLAVAALVVVCIVLVVALSRDRIGFGEGTGTVSEEDSLSKDLEREFGNQPHVEFVCSFAVVGPAPCVVDSDMGSREVALTFTNYELPEGVPAEEQARRIAVLAFRTSAFTKRSDRTDVIFEDLKGGDSAMVTTKYSFRGEELAAGESSRQD